jgi:beta-galactosidase
VKVYSNCPKVELFVNGTSAGIRKRDIQDFPAAGLRWEILFRDGTNTIRAVATRGNETISEEVSFIYQVTLPGVPAHLTLRIIEHAANQAVLEATLLDAANILCIEARHTIRFTVAGAGCLIDNQGTSTGSRVVQLYNGRAQIAVMRNAGPITVSVNTDGVVPASCTL